MSIDVDWDDILDYFRDNPGEFERIMGGPVIIDPSAPGGVRPYEEPPPREPRGIIDARPAKPLQPAPMPRSFWRDARRIRRRERFGRS